MHKPGGATPFEALSGGFAERHIGPTPDQQKAMLQQLGISSIEELTRAVVPPNILSTDKLDLTESCSEQQALKELAAIADRNQLYRSFIGQGYYNCYTPNVIGRNILENPAWYTAYTPYQPEISQGRLEALLNYQTMICDLTGMDLANASLLDEATAAAEAMTMCQRLSRSKSKLFFVSQDCLPQTIDVIQTRARPIGVEIKIGDHRVDLQGLDCFGVLLQYPAAGGEVHDYHKAIEQAHAQRSIVVMAADILALMLLKSPGELGADIAIGCSQRFGVPPGFGGPHAAYMATREAFKRAMPGRIVGVSIDSHGQNAYRLALQTREQHIRREKATSNICTAQVLLAVMASMYAVYHGPLDLKRIAQRTHYLARLLASGLQDMGYTVGEQLFFDTLTLPCGEQTTQIHKAARDRQVNLREVNSTSIGVSLDETTTLDDVMLLWEIFDLQGNCTPNLEQLQAKLQDILPDTLLRTDTVLNHPVFNRHHSETEMLRYIRSLADKDIALDRAMIPLGSCTMKLNATSEMLPITWPQFSQLHPFVPLDQAQGYLQVIQELQQMLCAITGYDSVSLQPNAGSQGEYAGLLAIKGWHESRGDAHRNICLIPGSAHGTNPASAQMCGMRVVLVKCDDSGNVDIEDLRNKALQHSSHLAAIMVTYPSTHGVFEEQITELCEIVHAHGGQVYMDGANLNAMVGLCYPGKFGSDVSHLNLHKTFSIPHGGGGPGVGPVAVRSHLAEFLPGHASFTSASKTTIGPVSAAAWGSASILPISWMYVRMMGPDSLRHATEVAILSANYIASRLSDYYPVLYTGANDLVAHECIIDVRPIKETSGISVDDIAKRLIDYGFHAPTMSFPVAGTLMVEPTESEPLEELDRFCDAMIKIHGEIMAIQNGIIDEDDNPLKNAPHTCASLLTSDWQHAYSREQAAYPVATLRQNKYWPPVGRIDNVYGDRNLICSCPAITEYEQEEVK